MKDSITYVGLDTHKAQHTVAILYPGQDEPKEMVVKNTVGDIRRLVRRIARWAPGPVRYCYEAGVCGFTVYRQIFAAGGWCMVVAPSLVPVRPGDRVKTDRRDARKLARLLGAGMLTEVRPPNEAEESVRELCRCREAALKDLNRTRHRLSKFLLRRGSAYHEGTQWTQRHMAWVRGVSLEQAWDREVLASYLSELSQREERLAELKGAVKAVARTEPYRQAVGWLECFCGIKTITAMTILSELHGFERFGDARSLMCFLGLVPSEKSSGQQERKGGITKAGNGRVRRALIEAAWHQRRSAVASKTLRLRRRGQPAWVIAIADRAQRRLYRRFWRLVERGKSSPKAVTAVARELAGFLWSVLRYARSGGPPEGAAESSPGVPAAEEAPLPVVNEAMRQAVDERVPYERRITVREFLGQKA